jgi:glycosyltransferase involved in cell wall biosynthesis
MYCMDVWPACLAAGGLRPDSRIYYMFGKISQKLYNRANIILISSQMFREYLKTEHNVPDERIEYLPQYASSQFENLPTQGKKDTIDFVFAGNVGAAQRLDIILQVAKKIQSEVETNKPIRWHIVGDGSELNNLKELATKLKLDNVIFHGRKPMEDMPKYYAMADAMLVSLTADPFISLTLPGKVQTYMAAGKPILASANGETPIVINNAQCGYCAPAEDIDAFMNIVKQFISQSDRELLGINAQKYYEAHFTRNRFMDELERELKEAVQ